MTDAFRQINWSLVISFLALGVSTLSFYWNAIRIRRAFYLVFVGNLSHGLLPQFALVNSGNRDILITSITFLFHEKDKTVGFVPAQQIQLGEDNSMLLPALRGFHGKIRFGEPFSPELVKTGDKMDGMGGHYQFAINADIQWLDMAGTVHQRAVPYAKAGVSEAGHLEIFGPAMTKISLYERRRWVTTLQRWIRDRKAVI